MTTMRGWQIHEVGEPSAALRLQQVPIPSPGPRQLLVRMLATPANFPDVLMIRGAYQVRPPLPFTPGVEVCGEVVGIGPEVTGFALGDRVMGGAGLPSGGFAEYALMDEGAAFPAPPSLDDQEAAAFTFGYQTGWVGLHRRARIQSGETLLVHAAAGGVGSAAVQLGKAAGATVIGVAGNASKAAIVRDLGADVVVDRSSDDFVEVVKDVTEGRGADVVYDPVGGDAYLRSAKCVAFEGRIILVGFAGGQIQAPPLNHALIKNYSIVGLHWGLYFDRNRPVLTECHEELMQLVAQGALKPLISERRKLEDVAIGVQGLADGSTVGRVVFSA